MTVWNFRSWVTSSRGNGGGTSLIGRVLALEKGLESNGDSGDTLLGGGDSLGKGGVGLFHSFEFSVHVIDDVGGGCTEFVKILRGHRKGPRGVGAGSDS